MRLLLSSTEKTTATIPKPRRGCISSGNTIKYSIGSVAIKYFLHFNASCSLRLFLEVVNKKHQKY